jgi:hypothetical protein
MSDATFEISIPADNDGYALMQCPNCGEFFKVKPDDFEDDGFWKSIVRLAVL